MAFKMPFVIIADDLSGAGDAGVQFAKRGFATEVVLDLETPLDPDATVVVYDTDSRMLAPGAAAKRITSLLTRHALSPARIFKKIDSTLRGPIGAEVTAVLEAFPQAVAFVVPAFPANLRTTHAGEQYVAGQRVHETPIGRDPKTPVRTAHIAHILGAQATIVGIEAVHSGLPSMRAMIENGRAAGARRFVFDAQSDEDLRAIATLAPSYPDALWVGSAGILAFLEPKIDAGSPILQPPHAGTPLLVIAGSLNATTREQVARFAHAGALVVDLRTDHVHAEPFGETIARDMTRTKEAFRAGRSVAVVIGPDGAGASGREARAVRLANRLGILAAALVSDLKPAALFLTGGDIARAACTALGIGRFTVIDELEPGIPLSRAGALTLITKAGGFGSPDSLVRIEGRLRGARL